MGEHATAATNPGGVVAGDDHISGEVTTLGDDVGRLAARLIEAQQKGDPGWVNIAQELAARVQVSLAPQPDAKSRSVARAALDLAVAVRELIASAALTGTGDGK